MQPNTAGNPASAQPMRGLSQRAQKLLGPKRYGQMPVVPPKTNGSIPNALRSARTA